MGTGPKKVLLIDEDLSSSEIISGALEPAGHSVMVATSSQEGIDKALHSVPDVIFMNLLLPGSNGLKTSKIIHSLESCRNVPVIMLVSYEGELDPKYTASIGIIDVLVKPFSADVVTGKMNKIFGTMDENFSAEEEYDGISYSEFPEEPAEAGDDILIDEDELEKAASQADTSFISAENDDDDFGVHENADELRISEEYAEDSSVVPEQDNEFSASLQSTPGDVSFSEEPVMESSDSEDSHEAYYDLEGEHDRDVIPEEKIDGDQIPDSDFLKDLEYESFLKAEKNRTKKYIFLAAAVVLVAGAVFLTLRANRLFFKDSIDKQPAPSVKTGETAVTPQKELITEKDVSGEVKLKDYVAPDKGGSGPEVTDSGKKVPPVAPQEKGEASERAAAASPPVQKSATRGPVTQEPKTVASAKKIVRKEKKTAQSKTDSFYSVQAGAFSNEKNALSFSESLKKTGYDSFILQDETGSGKPLHRVLIGRFDSREEALEHSRLLLDNEGIKSIIYRK